MLARMHNWSAWVCETRPDVLHSTYKALLKRSGFKILGECQAMFDPMGYTLVFLLSESHLAIHTFPERGKTYIELTSCVEPQYRAFLAMHPLNIVDGD